MPPNSVVKNSILVGGLTVLGYVAGGKLGSMLGAVIGTVVCSLFNTEGPMGPTGYPDPDNRSPRHQHSTYYPPRPSNNRENHKSKTKKLKDKSEPQLSKCSICLEPFKPSILLLPCSHMCFCDDCYDKVKAQKVSTCPICRDNITEFMFVYPS